MQINTSHGGQSVYWSEPDGHAWEILTVSYARQPGGKASTSAVQQFIQAEADSRL
jgi:hypothetical protein